MQQVTNMKKQQPLIELPDGAWVRPDSITSITPLVWCDNIGPRVIVRYDKGIISNIYTDTYAQALDIARDIASNVNSSINANNINDGEDEDKSEFNFPTIIITKRTLDFLVFLKGHPEKWRCGKTEKEAIGNFFMSYSNLIFKNS